MGIISNGWLPLEKVARNQERKTSIRLAASSLSVFKICLHESQEARVGGLM